MEKNTASTCKNSYDLQEAVGPYQAYRSGLGEIAPERQLYLAVPQRVHEGIWTKRFGQLILQNLHLCLIVFDEQQDKDYHVDTLTHYRTILGSRFPQPS